MRKLKNEELNRKSIDEFKASEKLPLYIVLDNIRSLNNIGSVFRSSDAFLVKKVFLCGITATPPHKDIQKTALGATDAVDWAYENSALDLIERLQKEGVLVLAIEQAEGARSLVDFIPEKNKTYAVVLGNEVLGVQQTVVDRADDVLEIPQEGTKHSLNIAVATGVVLWDFYQKFKRQ